MVFRLPQIIPILCPLCFCLIVRKVRTAVFVWENFLYCLVVVRKFGSSAGTRLGLSILLLYKLMGVVKAFGNSCKIVLSVWWWPEKRKDHSKKCLQKCQCSFNLIGELYAQVLKALNAPVCCTNCHGMLCLIYISLNGKWRCEGDGPQVWESSPQFL